MSEANFPLMMDDFEVGDRIYVTYRDGEIELGTVRDIRTDERMNVLLDSGRVPFVHIDQFGPRGQYHKCFPVEQLQVGSVISIYAGSGQRFYADVVDYVPNEYVELEYREGKNEGAFIGAEKGKPLEVQLAPYTLEG